MNQESKKQAAEGTKSPSPAQKPTVENLLDDFGGRSSSPSVEPTPIKKRSNPAESTAPSKNTEAKKSVDEKKTTATSSAKKESASRVKAKAPSEKKTDGVKTDKKQTVRASTGNERKAAPQNTKKEASSKAERSAQSPRSAKLAHQIIPYVLIILAVFIGVSLVLNIFCNPSNKLADDPSAHWMGVVGYYLCYGLFGVLGMAVLVLPFLLLNLSFYWKKYIDNRLTISKIVASLVFSICLAALIHVFALMALESGSRDLSASDLFYYGAKMQGGGLIGGGFGYFLYSYLSWTGSIILLVALLAASLFYCLGMTPQYLWNRYRMHRAERRARKQQSLSAQNAEDAKSKAELEEKLRRKSNGTQMSSQDAAADGSPNGAVEIVDAALRKSDRLAPIPMPLLDPTDGTRPFVPTDVSRKMEADPSSATPSVSASPAGKTQKVTAETAAPKQSAAPTPQNTPATPAAPAIDSAKNRDTAIDPIFPKSIDAKQARKVPRTERDFDLKNVFIDLDDRPNPAPKKHATLPPEAPLPGSVRKTAPQNATATRPAAPTAARPASSAPVRPSTVATPQSSVRTQMQPSTGARPASLSTLAGKNAPKTASGAQKPLAHRLDTTADQKFGLSDEEFEKLEASRTIPSRTGTQKPSAGGAKAASAARAATAAKPSAPQALVKTKKYVFPPVSYLHEAVPMSAENEAEIAETVTQLQETLQNFHVSIKDIQYACGPTATRYEVFPAPGVRVRSFLNLSDDIALALAAGGIRMEAPIPGKSAVGIEVPNKNRATVFLRELIDSKAFKTASSKLTACLGSDIAGKPLLFDISKMPHLLVAGTTGSGKSVCINCTIMSILYKAKPDEVKLVLIDPKKVEFSIYKNIPHLMAPIVTTPKDAAGALQAAVEEMERRFEVFEEIGVHDLKGYNEITKNDPDMPYLPQIVIIIDELADLMMTAPDEVETAICRIAQKARAAGMHLIVGTQRPSVDVVTGLIKSNIPSRIAFTVASQVDSKTILDYAGAEKLAGRGDMLFAPIGALKPSRVQGAYVDEKEVEKVCDFIRTTNGTAQYDEKFISKLKELAAQCGSKKGGGGGSELPSGTDSKDGDSKYADAVRVAIEEKRVSTSLLQRKLEIGYGRAAKIIDRMQAEGIVSPPDGAKPRTILITPEEYMDRFLSGDGEKTSGEG